MTKRTLSLAPLLAAGAAFPAQANLSTTVEQVSSPCPILCPGTATTSNFELAAAQKTFTLVDPQSKAKVETYRLQPGWSGFGTVKFNRDASGANVLLWMSGFNHTSGAKAFRDSERVAMMPSAFANSGYVKNGAAVAKEMAKIVAERAQAQNVQPTSFNIVDCNDTEVNKLAAGFRQQYGKQANITTKVMLGEFSFTKNNQPWQAEIRLPLLISEARLMGGMYSTMVIHLYQEMYIYPKAQRKNCLNAAQAILKSCTIDKDWANTCAQLRTGVSTGAINSARQQADIWRQTGNDISDMNRDSYNKRNASQDRMSQKRSDATLGNVTTTDPFNSGRKITVKDNADYIWVNSSGEQCGSNNSNYNPNQDPRRNNETWKLIKK